MPRAPFQHGLGGYTNATRCRCQICTEAMVTYSRERRQKIRAGTWTPATQQHGIGGTLYEENGCRCEPCVSYYTQLRTARRAAWVRANPGRHDAAAYENGCRCQVCRDADWKRKKASRAKARGKGGSPVAPVIEPGDLAAGGGDNPPT